MIRVVLINDQTVVDDNRDILVDRIVGVNDDVLVHSDMLGILLQLCTTSVS